MAKIYRNKPVNRSRYYINNKELLNALIEFKKSVSRSHNLPPDMMPKIPNYVGECILLLCNRLSYRPNFAMYSYRDDMVGDGIENCISAVHNFDHKKSNNAFGYFTQIAWNAFIRKIQREKKQSYIKYKNFENSYLLNESSNFMDSDDGKMQQKKTNINVDEFISNFERTMNKPRKKKGKKGVALLMAK